MCCNIVLSLVSSIGKNLRSGPCFALQLPHGFDHFCGVGWGTPLLPAGRGAHLWLQHWKECEFLMPSKTTARQRFQQYDDDDPTGWVGWTECGHCALFQLCGAASHRQPKLVSARHACKMMMTMMMIMTTAMSMTVHVLKVNNLQQMLNQKYLLYKVITSNQSWQRKYRVGR